MRAFWLFCVLALAMWLAPGCSTALAGPPDKRKPIVEKGGEQISRGIIQEGLETLDTAESRARLGRILNSEEVREAVHDLAASMVLGVYDGVRTARQTHGGVEVDFASSFDDAMNRHVTPALARLASRTISSAIAASLSEENIARIEALGERGTQAAIRGLSRGIEQDLGPALAATLDKDVGPAMAIVMERDLMPAFARSLETPEMQQAIASIARSLGTEVVTGAGEAIAVDEDQGRTLSLFGGTIALGYAIALFAAFALGTMSVVLTVLLVRNSRRLRRMVSDAASKEKEATA